MKNWKDLLNLAQFRDAKFFVLDHRMSGGRRVVVHDFPFQDVPLVEDLGRKSKSFSLSGFVIGDNYFSTRDALIAALDKQGSGVLTHPYLGNKEVNCVNYTLTESTDTGAMAHFSMEFHESGNKLVVENGIDSKSKIADLSNQLREKAADNLARIYDVINTAKSGIQKAKDQVNNVVRDMNNAQKLCADVAQVGQDFSQLVKEISNGIDKIIAFPDKVSALFTASFAAVSSSIDGLLSKSDTKRTVAAASLLQGISGSLASPYSSQTSQNGQKKQTPALDAKRLNAWSSLARYKVTQKNITHSTSVEANAEKNNGRIIETTTRLFALSYLEDCAASARFSTVSEVRGAQDNFLSISDDLMASGEGLIPDDVFQIIENLGISVRNALNAVENRLPVITEIAVGKNTNTLCFLYEKFSDLSKESDLIYRNNIADPASLTVGQKLQVVV